MGWRVNQKSTIRSNFRDHISVRHGTVGASAGRIHQKLVVGEEFQFPFRIREFPENVAAAAGGLRVTGFSASEDLVQRGGIVKDLVAAPGMDETFRGMEDDEIVFSADFEIFAIPFFGSAFHGALFFVGAEDLSCGGECGSAGGGMFHIQKMHEPSRIPGGDSRRRIGEIGRHLDSGLRIHGGDGGERIAGGGTGCVEFVGDTGKTGLRRLFEPVEPAGGQFQMVGAVGVDRIEESRGIQVGSDGGAARNN